MPAQQEPQKDFDVNGVTVVLGQVADGEYIKRTGLRFEGSAIAPGNLTQDEQDAIDGANAPDAGNPFATIADIGGGASGTVRLLDLGVVEAADLASGPITLYTPAAGELVGPVIVKDVAYTPTAANNSIVICEDGGLPLLAGWDSDLARDGYWISLNEDNKLAQVTDLPVIATLAPSGVTQQDVPFSQLSWVASTPFGTAASIIAAGHFWISFGAGTSGLVEPDWASGFGGTVTDNDITWGDGDPLAGSAHVYAYVCVPVSP